MEQGGEEVAGYESAYDGHNDIDQQVRAVMHDFSRYLTDNCGNNEVNNDI